MPASRAWAFCLSLARGKEGDRNGNHSADEAIRHIDIGVVEAGVFRHDISHGAVVRGDGGARGKRDRGEPLDIVRVQMRGACPDGCLITQEDVERILDSDFVGLILRGCGSGLGLGCVRKRRDGQLRGRRLGRNRLARAENKCGDEERMRCAMAHQIGAGGK